MRPVFLSLQVAEKVNARQVPLHKFLITKQLTKAPRDYPDGNALPHVQARDAVSPPATCLQCLVLVDAVPGAPPTWMMDIA